MVLVSMSDDDAAELVLILEDIGVIGKNQVDARLRIIGEHESGVDKDHIGTALDNGHILADTIKTAKGDDLQRRSILFSCSHMDSLSFR